MSEACPLCGDTGWKTIDRDGVRQAVRCDCRVKGRGERLLTAARIPARYEHCELNTFQDDPDDKRHKSIRDARFLAGRFVEEYPMDKTGLLFVGSVGVGKTHLAVGIIKSLIREKGIHCLFCDYRELLKQIQNSYNASVQATEMEVLRPVFDAEVLVLDELGVARSTEWVTDTVNYILSKRYNENKTTIITTNYSDAPERQRPKNDSSTGQEQAEYSGGDPTLGDRITARMWSRLHEMCRKVEMEGDDHRRTAKRAQFRSVSGASRFSLRNRASVARQSNDGSSEIQREILAAIAKVGSSRPGKIGEWRNMLPTHLRSVDDEELIAGFKSLCSSGLITLHKRAPGDYSDDPEEDAYFFGTTDFTATLT